MGLGLAATDQVTHQQELPTHCAKTETAGGEDTGSSDLLPKHPLEEEMATYFSILAWRSPWTEEPGKRKVSEVTPHY